MPSLAHLDHTAISCPSKGGKSALARSLMVQFRLKGYEVLVCDPLGYTWPANFVTTDEYALLDEAKRRENCALFIDEAGMTDLSKARELHWLYTTSRHRGHVAYTMMQDYTAVAPSIRKQCSQLYIFNHHPAEAEIWAHQFHRSADFIKNHVLTMQRYQFIRVRIWDEPQGPVKINL